MLQIRNQQLCFLSTCSVHISSIVSPTRSCFMGSCTVFLFFTLFSSLLFHFVTAIEFLVGGENGWAVPKKDDEMYNEWASKNRFKVDDTVKFEYKKDSVLVVTEEEYKKCRSAQPFFFSNNGNTVFKLDRPGFFYFISGVAGHCERGQKMIIKVLELQTPPQSGNDTSSPDNPKKNTAVEMAAIKSTMIILLSISVLGLLFV